MKPIACVLSLSLSLGAPALHGLTVSGTVTDAAGAAIPLIEVEVFDEGVVLDERLDVVDADAAGVYSSDRVEAGHDVYIKAAWRFALFPKVAYNGHAIRLVDTGTGSPFAVTGTFTAAKSATSNNVAANAAINLAMAQAQPVGLSTLIERIQQTLDYVENNKGAVAWSVDYDIPVHIKLTGADNVSFQDEGEIFLWVNTFNGFGTTFNRVTLYHEMSHLIHYHHNGKKMPPLDYGPDGGHSINSEEEPGCALVEGYASYIAQLVAESVNPPVTDPFYRNYRDDGLGGFPANSLWRGDETRPTGRDGESFESGEDVEGAFSGFQFGVHDAFGFETNFKAMVDHDPPHAFAFRQALLEEAGRTTIMAREIYTIMQTHGIVSNRARFRVAGESFDLEPFDVEEPEDEAPPAAGNRKVINFFTFLRGTVPTRFEAVPAEDLGVDQTIATEAVKVGIKPAADGLADLPGDFQFLPASADFSAGVIDLDTTTFGGASGDGDWDLLVRAENEALFDDDFLPTWAGDGNTRVNSDEEYLKVLGAWYDRDRDPSDDALKEGMVIVDNTAPTVSNFKPR